MPTQAVILAGGKGTRLASRLGGRPKPLIDVLGKPLLERQVEQLRDYGVDRVLVLVNHQAAQIEAFFAARDLGVHVQIIDDGEPRGTAGAVYRARDRLDEEFLIVYGDTLFDVDLTRFLRFHAGDPGAAATLFLHPNDHPQDSDLVEVDADGIIRAFHGYPHPAGVWLPNMVNAALYAMRRGAIESGALASLGEGVVDFAKDLFPRLVEDGARLRGYISPEYLKDIGTPARLDRGCADLRSGKVARMSLRFAQTAVFLDRDGTLNAPNGHVASPEALEVFAFAPAAVKALNATDHRVVLVTNQPVVARGEASVEDLALIHAKLDTVLGAQGAYLDRAYYCPHHPDKGFVGERAELKIACECRKPRPGLLHRAQADLNLDLSRSWLIGDSAADMAAARACGVRAVLVRTGESRGSAAAEADFVFDTVLEAANFIAQDASRGTPA
jgi:D,D-heptose 1,7-bisphosphate phosphatase